jgi:dCMP deaminase
LRPDFKHYIFGIAREVAKRSTCSRLQVGAVAVRDGRILATGYNGAPTHWKHCDHTEKPDERCTISVHAEANVVAMAARFGIPLDGATIYITHSPCDGCMRLMRNAGIAKIVYDKEYGTPPKVDLADEYENS